MVTKGSHKKVNFFSGPTTKAITPHPPRAQWSHASKKLFFLSGPVLEFTANLYCICLSKPQTYAQMQSRFAVNFGSLSIALVRKRSINNNMFNCREEGSGELTPEDESELREDDIQIQVDQPCPVLQPSQLTVSYSIITKIREDLQGCRFSILPGEGGGQLGGKRKKKLSVKSSKNYDFSYCPQNMGGAK